MTDQKTDKKTRRKATVELSTMVYGKIPPQARDLEAGILGAIMLEPSAFDRVSDILKPECFYVDAHQKIYRAMAELSLKSQPADLITLSQKLRELEILDLIGGPYFLTKLQEQVVSTAGLEYNSRIIVQQFMKREMIKISGETISQAYEESSDAFDIMDEHDKAMTELTNGAVTKNLTSVSSEVAKSIARMEQLRHQDNHITGVPSGFQALDKITHGWQDTDLIILAARPAVGKTAFALNLARNAALGESHKPVAFFCLEMSTQQLVNRMISAETNIWLERISHGMLDDDHMKILYGPVVENLTKAPIFFDDTPALGLMELRAKCRRLKSKHNLGIIIIDYLQLMSGTGDKRSNNREQEIANISRGLKALAKELRLPIIALSQLSRATESRKGEAKMPQLSDLRESGAIEQDADMVMFMYRPEYYNVATNEMGESNDGLTEIRIAKHRNGSLDTIKLKALLHIQKFKEWEQTDFITSQLPPSTAGWKPVVDKSTNDNGLLF